MKITGRLAGFFPLVFFGLLGCHELGHIDGPGGYGSGTDLVGEIQYVDTRDLQIQLRTDAGRTWSVGYDRQTRVTYRQRDYDVTNLEPGDFVAMRTTQDRNGRLYTDLITVRESSQDRGFSGRRGGTDLRGVVQRNDPRYSSILVQTDDRRQVAFYHDARTQIRYRNRVYPVTSIAPGDYIIVRTRDLTQENPTATMITVTSKAGGSDRTIDRLEVLEGRIEYVDSRRGTFEIRDRQNRLVFVTLSYNAPRSVSDHLNRLRRGDYVRIEGRFIADNRFELESFV